MDRQKRTYQRDILLPRIVENGIMQGIAREAMINTLAGALKIDARTLDEWLRIWGATAVKDQTLHQTAKPSAEARAVQLSLPNFTNL